MSKLSGKDLGALVAQLGVDATEWDAVMMKMEADMLHAEKAGSSIFRKLGASLDRVAAKMEQVGMTLTRRVTAPIMALGGLAVREFGNFDAAMTQSLAIMGNVSSAMRNEMEQAARNVGKTMSMSATEAAQSYFYLASAGMTAEQSVAALPQVAKFAQAGMFDMATATDLATDAQSALGLTAKDTQENLKNLTRVTDVLVKANTLANATVEQFSTALTTESGAALKTFGKDMEEGVAVLAAFADQGVKGQVAGSGLSRIIRLMTAAAVNNKDAMRALGLEIFDSQGKMRNMADIIENLEDSLAGMSDAQRVAALESIGFTARVQGVIMPLLGSSNAIRQYERQLRSAGGTTEEVSNKQMQGFNMQLKLLWDNIRDIGIAFGKTLEPALRRLINWTRGVVESLQEMDHEARVRVLAMAALFAASGPLLIALAKAARIIAGFATFITSKFGMILAAFTAGAVAGQWLVDNWEKAKAGWQVIMKGMHMAAVAMAEGVVRATKWMTETLINLTPSGMISNIFGFDVGEATTSLMGYEKALEALRETSDQVFEDLARSIVEFNNTGDFTTIRESLGNLFETIMSLTGADKALEDFYALFDQAGSGADAAGGEVEEFVRTVYRALPQAEIAIKRFAAISTEEFQKIPDALSKVSDKTIEMSDALQTSITQAATSFAESIGQILAGGTEAGNFFDKLLMIVADFASQFGRIVMAMGVAALQLQQLLVNPVAAIAAGAALVALGAAAKALIAKGPGGVSSGGAGSAQFTPSMRNAVPNQEIRFRIGQRELIGVLNQGNLINARVGRPVNITGG